jgi:hypothetical protein
MSILVFKSVLSYKLDVLLTGCSRNLENLSLQEVSHGMDISLVYDIDISKSNTGYQFVVIDRG